MGVLNFLCNYNRWTGNMTMEKAIEFLKNNNIKFEEIPYKLDEETKLLLTEGKVEIVFDCQLTPGNYTLYKAGRFIIHRNLS